MKKVLTTLCAALIAGVGFAQTDYPFKDYEGDLYLRSGFTFQGKPEIPNAVVYVNDLYKLERNQETGIYHVAVELDKYHEGIPDKSTGKYGNCPYYYTTVFEGKNTEEDAGAQIYQDMPRTFQLDGVDATSGKQTVNFYAKLAPKLEFKTGYNNSTPRIMFICDAQRLYYANTSYVETPFPLPDQNGRTCLVVGDGTKTGIDMQYQIYTHTTDKWARYDVFQSSNVSDGKYNDLLPAKSVNGRWMFEYDYPTLTLSVYKMLDQLQNAAVIANGNELGADLGELDMQTGLYLGGTLNTFTFDKTGQQAANIEAQDVTVRLCYQIDEEPVAFIAFPTGTKQTLQYNHEQINYELEGQDILQGQSLSNGEHNLKIWFEAEYLGDILKEDNNGAYYTTTFTINNASNPLENKGTSTNLILTGDWSQDAFDTIIGGNATNITTVDFTEVTGLTELPIIEGLNPNCLFYVNQDVTIPEGTDNVVVFNGETGRAANIVLTESHNFNNVKSFTADKVSYSRNFMDTGWFTMCLPFSVDKGDVVVEEFTNVEGNEIVFTKAESIEANVPYLAKTETPEVKNFKAMGVEINSTENLSPVTPVGGYAFYANYQVIDGENAVGLYLMNNAGTAFAKVAEGNPYSSGVPAFRAYFTTTANKQLVIGHDDGGATNVSSTESADKLIIISNDGSIEIIAGKAQIMNLYALDGRLVRALELNEGSNFINGLNKGIYIINHQKVVVK